MWNQGRRYRKERSVYGKNCGCYGSFWRNEETKGTKEEEKSENRSENEGVDYRR